MLEDLRERADVRKAIERDILVNIVLEGIELYDYDGSPRIYNEKTILSVVRVIAPDKFKARIEELKAEKEANND